jgi:hypothetical protein
MNEISGFKRYKREIPAIDEILGKIRFKDKIS